MTQTYNWKTLEAQMNKNLEERAHVRIVKKLAKKKETIDEDFFSFAIKLTKNPLCIHKYNIMGIASAYYDIRHYELSDEIRWMIP